MQGWLDPEGYCAIMQDFEEDFGPDVWSPSSGSDDPGSGGGRMDTPPPSWGPQASLAIEEGYSS